MFKVLFLKKEADEGSRGIVHELCSRNFDCEQIAPDEDLDVEIINRAPDLIILDIEVSSLAPSIIHMIKELSRERPIPILALISKELLKGGEIPRMVEDFATKPCETEEIVVRTEKILKETYTVESKDLIRCGNLLIDLSRREAP